MKIIVSVLFAAALLCGCQKSETPKPATPEPATNRIQTWEYKVVEVANYARYQAMEALFESDTNSALGKFHLNLAERRDGSFEFGASYDTNKTYEKYDVDFYRLGSDGWELVAAVPQLETEPSAQYRNTRFNNTRTGKIILIFKRPK